VFLVGVSDAKKDWPYVQPGPRDPWAGARPHSFSICFALQDKPAENCDLTLAFVRECVEDHELSKTEISELENLITIFRIEEGEFYELRRDAIQEIMSAQAMWMLRDRYVTEEEEVLQRDLQRLFGLSYDQYVGLLRTLVGRHVETLESKKLVTHDSEELKSIDSSIRNLRGVFLVPR
jgi:hypothetical protein